MSFTRNPLAPARIARATYSSSSNVVTITTRTVLSAGSAAICSVVHSPSPSGIRMSRSATSTGVVADRAQQLLAAGCLHDDLDVGLRVQQRAEAGADELMVVGQRDPDHDAPAHGRRAVTIGAAALPQERASGRRPRVRRARACRGCPRPRRDRRETRAVVFDPDHEHVAAVAGLSRA